MTLLFGGNKKFKSTFNITLIFVEIEVLCKTLKQINEKIRKGKRKGSSSSHRKSKTMTHMYKKLLSRIFAKLYLQTNRQQINEKTRFCVFRHIYLPICSAVLMKRCEKMDNWMASNSFPTFRTIPLPIWIFKIPKLHNTNEK